MPAADHYDLVMGAIVVIATLLGGLVAGGWGFGFVFGCALGNMSAWILRRRAGIPDRSLVGSARKAWSSRRGRDAG
jgi:hypothetical protein